MRSPMQLAVKQCSMSCVVTSSSPFQPSVTPALLTNSCRQQGSREASRRPARQQGSGGVQQGDRGREEAIKGPGGVEMGQDHWRAWDRQHPDPPPEADQFYGLLHHHLPTQITTLTSMCGTLALTSAAHFSMLSGDVTSSCVMMSRSGWLACRACRSAAAEGCRAVATTVLPLPRSWRTNCGAGAVDGEEQQRAGLGVLEWRQSGCGRGDGVRLTSSPMPRFPPVTTESLHVSCITALHTTARRLARLQAGLRAAVTEGRVTWISGMSGKRMMSGQGRSCVM